MIIINSKTKGYFPEFHSCFLRDFVKVLVRFSSFHECSSIPPSILSLCSSSWPLGMGRRASFRTSARKVLLTFPSLPMGPVGPFWISLWAALNSGKTKGGNCRNTNRRWRSFRAQSKISLKKYFALREPLVSPLYVKVEEPLTESRIQLEGINFKIVKSLLQSQTSEAYVASEVKTSQLKVCDDLILCDYLPIWLRCMDAMSLHPASPLSARGEF